ncbi:branched-chain amino acid ABC transporter permease [Mesorhizobium sp. IMUNJ 23232]|uniref:branched-chain amino acid ABC transporter permease n=1 Tax=Mesorhizobium sp. IMUNJ 23232 TaxID=3376064 RepID=UPI003798519C
MTTQLAFAAFNGLVLGMAVFLVAAGLTLVFGILRVFNFAHGSFFMVGAYIAHAVMGREPRFVWQYLGAAVVAAIVIGIIGLIVDRVVLRRLAGVANDYTLIATFAILLLTEGAAKLIFGQDFYTVFPPPVLDQIVNIGIPVTYYSFFIIACGIIVFVLLEWGLNHLWFGKLVQAVARDPWMADVIGLRVQRLKLISAGASFALVGLAGALLVANQTLSLSLGQSYLLLAFNSVIIGGLGSVRGAFLAALILGLFESFNSVLLPSMPGVVAYVVLILVILLKPQGLFPERA